MKDCWKNSGAVKSDLEFSAANFNRRLGDEKCVHASTAELKYLLEAAVLWKKNSEMIQNFSKVIYFSKWKETWKESILPTLLRWR